MDKINTNLPWGKWISFAPPPVWQVGIWLYSCRVAKVDADKRRKGEQ